MTALQDTETGYGRILQILESQKLSQSEDMSAIQSELRKLSLEMCRICESQGVILNLLTKNRLDLSMMDKAKPTELQGFTDPVVSSTNAKQVTENNKEQSRSESLDGRDIFEFKDLNKRALEDSTLASSGAEVISLEHSTAALLQDQTPQLPPLEPATESIATASICFVQPYPTSGEQNTMLQPYQSVPALTERTKSSRLHSLVAKSNRLLFRQPQANVESSVRTLFDDELPHQGTVHKRILNCFGACVEGSTINMLWRRFLFEIFGIHDDELWSRQVGSGVIHPDSRFSRGKMKDRGCMCDRTWRGSSGREQRKGLTRTGGANTIPVCSGIMVLDIGGQGVPTGATPSALTDETPTSPNSPTPPPYHLSFISQRAVFFEFNSCGKRPQAYPGPTPIL
jgi:hypothetical protein